MTWIVLLTDAVGWHRYLELSEPPGDTITLPVSDTCPLWIKHWRLSDGAALFDRCRGRDDTGVLMYRWRAPSGRTDLRETAALF